MAPLFSKNLSEFLVPRARARARGRGRDPAPPVCNFFDNGRNTKTAQHSYLYGRFLQLLYCTVDSYPLVRMTTFHGRRSDAVAVGRAAQSSHLCVVTVVCAMCVVKVSW